MEETKVQLIGPPLRARLAVLKLREGATRIGTDGLVVSFLDEGVNVSHGEPSLSIFLMDWDCVRGRAFVVPAARDSREFDVELDF